MSESNTTCTTEEPEDTTPLTSETTTKVTTTSTKPTSTGKKTLLFQTFIEFEVFRS